MLSYKSSLRRCAFFAQINIKLTSRHSAKGAQARVPAPLERDPCDSEEPLLKILNFCETGILQGNVNFAEAPDSLKDNICEIALVFVAIYHVKMCGVEPFHFERGHVEAMVEDQYFDGLL